MATKETNDENDHSYLENNYNFISPIEYQSNVKIIDNNISKTLELVESIEENEIPIYQHIFLTKNKPSEISAKQIAKFYTTDVDFLENTQKIIKSIDNEKIKKNDEIVAALNYYEEIKKETSFHEKYLYFNFDLVKPLNTNPLVLGFTSIYNLTSPIISLCIPILILILPIIIIKMNGDICDLTKYVEILKPLIQQTSIGKLFINFNTSNDTQKIYLIFSAFFYCYSIYQNILNCIKFYSNVKKIHDYLLTFKSYLSDTIHNMEYFNSLIFPFDTYNNFRDTLSLKKNILTLIHSELYNITEFKFNFKKITEIGNLMATFYKFYNDSDYNDALTYSFGFNGYFSNLLQINIHIANNKLHKAKYIISKNNANIEDIIEDDLDVVEEKDVEEKDIEEKDVEEKDVEDVVEEKDVEDDVEEKVIEEEKDAEEKDIVEEKDVAEDDAEEKDVEEKDIVEDLDIKEHDKKMKNPKKTKLITENMFYPKFINSEETIVKNNCNLDKNIILTGPNASGKTTFIKSLFLNILLSQQIGYGCFSKLVFIPYDYFHCYLNIPDTSGRDSLFQAEARRCKNILNFITDNDSDETHFCIFDELYSGTNPDEAIISANAFIQYISSLNNVSFSLTTHYVDLCEKIDKYTNIINCNMKTFIDENTKNINYTYVLNEGISKVKNGVQILKNMNYPDNILKLIA
jgi:energy-coupling factor transporter ATP-binding protein EcfA2